MFSMLVQQQKVCVTSQLLDVLDPIINSTSQSVLDFFNNSFYITDQYAGLRALEWEEEGEEKICATTTAYMTDEFLQSLVKISDKVVKEEEVVVVEEHDHNHDGEAEELHEIHEDAPFKYNAAVEPRTYIPEDSKIKQVEAKILDFNWVFIGDNSARMMNILA